MPNWDDVQVTIGGRKLEGIKNISYSGNKPELRLKITDDGVVKFTQKIILQFYWKRKNKYYFKSTNGFKYVVENEENLPVVKGLFYEFY